MFAGFLDTATQYRTISGSFDLGSWSEGTVHPSRRHAGRQAEQLQATVASSVRGCCSCLADQAPERLEEEGRPG